LSFGGLKSTFFSLFYRLFPYFCLITPLMTRAIVVFFATYLLISCSERLVCPAYQSAFIYDKDELRKKFSYFEGDTTPKLQYTASKNKYLVAEPVSYRTKIRTMQTVKMKPVYVMVPDSLSGKKSDSVSMADLDRAARSVIDSTFIQDVPQKDSVAAPLDSIYVITKDKELRLLKYNSSDSLDYDSITHRYIRQKPEYYVRDVRYNLEQNHYMWYLRNSLVLPDVRLAKMQQSEGGKEGSGKSGKKKQGLKGFFKNLFKKKKKDEVDSASLKPPVKEEFDFIDEADTVSKAEIPLPGQEDVKPKRGLFGPKKDRPKKERKKKEKKPKKEEAKPEEKVKKKEDEDDGF
jgi:hypothetical protein